jgi:predicted kinase
MSGRVKLNYTAFRLAAEVLLRAGHTVVNPHDLDKKDRRGSWEDCLKRDLVALTRCDGVAVLPDWKKSRGARLEVYVAKKVKIPVKPVGGWF